MSIGDLHHVARRFAYFLEETGTERARGTVADLVWHVEHKSEILPPVPILDFKLEFDANAWSIATALRRHVEQTARRVGLKVERFDGYPERPIGTSVSVDPNDPTRLLVQIPASALPPMTLHPPPPGPPAPSYRSRVVDVPVDEQDIVGAVNSRLRDLVGSRLRPQVLDEVRRRVDETLAEIAGAEQPQPDKGRWFCNALMSFEAHPRCPECGGDRRLVQVGVPDAMLACDGCGGMFEYHHKEPSRGWATEPDPEPREWSREALGEWRDPE